jgi:hypothetical protein
MVLKGAVTPACKPGHKFRRYRKPTRIEVYPRVRAPALDMIRVSLPATSVSKFTGDRLMSNPTPDYLAIGRRATNDAEQLRLSALHLALTAELASRLVAALGEHELASSRYVLGLTSCLQAAALHLHGKLNFILGDDAEDDDSTFPTVERPATSHEGAA